MGTGLSKQKTDASARVAAGHQQCCSFGSAGGLRLIYRQPHYRKSANAARRRHAPLFPRPLDSGYPLIGLAAAQYTPRSTQGEARRSGRRNLIDIHLPQMLRIRLSATAV